MMMPGTPPKPLTRSNEATLRPLAMASVAPVARTSRRTCSAPGSGRASSGCGEIGASVPSKSSATRAVRRVGKRLPLADGDEDLHVLAGGGELEGLGDLIERPGDGDEVLFP